MFNALLSGSIYGGLPANKITAIAGESATGKTFTPPKGPLTLTGGIIKPSSLDTCFLMPVILLIKGPGVFLSSLSTSDIKPYPKSSETAALSETSSISIFSGDSVFSSFSLMSFSITTLFDFY